MDKKKLKIAFMGTPSIAAYVFEAMISDGYNFACLIAQPDKPSGRKGEVIKVPTKKVAEKYNIPVYQPIKIRKDYEFLKEINPDVIVTLAYGQIVPQGLLDIPKFGCLNLHGSLLPKYRGAAPIQYSLINNEKVTGVTLMEMIDKMDAGRIFSQREIVIDENDNSTSLFEKIAIAAKELIIEDLPKYLDGKLPGVEQDESLVTYCPTIKPEEEKLNLNQSAKNVYGWIRGLADKPGGYVLLDELKLKIFKAKVVNSNLHGSVGEIVQANKNGLLVKCKEGLISIIELQKEGKKRMDFISFCNGNQNLVGKILK